MRHLLVNEKCFSDWLAWLYRPTRRCSNLTMMCCSYLQNQKKSMEWIVIALIWWILLQYLLQSCSVPGSWWRFTVRHTQLPLETSGVVGSVVNLILGFLLSVRTRAGAGCYLLVIDFSSTVDIFVWYSRGVLHVIVEFSFLSSPTVLFWKGLQINTLNTRKFWGRKGCSSKTRDDGYGAWTCRSFVPSRRQSKRDVTAGTSFETGSAISNSNRLWKGSAKMQGSRQLGDLATLMCSDGEHNN